MFSRFHELAAVLLAVAGVAGCEREQRRFSEPGGDSLTITTPLSDIKAGGPVQSATGEGQQTTGISPYDQNAFAISEGQRLYEWFNCSGCHAHGGGAMGPALMDDQWIYGGAPDQIYSTIVQGRPNGMPSFGARIPRQQVWQLVAYVRSLSGQLRKDVEPGRPDAMQMRPAPSQTPEPRNPGATR
jgi:cytochrome c oxidase cbb3-type subunit 3